jgi:hypothetical protein
MTIVTALSLPVAPYQWAHTTGVDLLLAGRSAAICDADGRPLITWHVKDHVLVCSAPILLSGHTGDHDAAVAATDSRWDLAADQGRQAAAQLMLDTLTLLTARLAFMTNDSIRLLQRLACSGVAAGYSIPSDPYPRFALIALHGLLAPLLNEISTARDAAITRHDDRA